jgi:hypothetical protein
MQMQLGIESHIPDGLLAANALLAENSRQGVPTSTQALYQGFGFAISSTYMGLQFRCYESTSDPVEAPSNVTQPCTQRGNALPATTYQTKGQAAANNPVQDALNLAAFRAGGALDAQPLGATPAYANYVYGVYMSAAGYSLNQTLAGADIYAQYRGKYQPGTPFAGPNYPYTPQVNIAYITVGFNAQQGGNVCH